ncbi:MAG: DeoR/GlpR family DNA-binding transcription regulator [Thermodesulfobacteriota bacterium]
MHYTERREQLLEFIRKSGYIRAVDLPERFGVSLATVRRDLAILEKSGHLQRTSGGAVLEKRSLLELSSRQRESHHIHKKQKIAEKALSYIEPNNRIFFNDGTTVMQLAKMLSQKDMPLVVMTNSLKIADTLVYNKHINVILIGGDIKEFSYASSGPLAELMVSHLNADKAVIGADAFHPVKGICIQPIGEAILTMKMISNAEKVIALGDSSKIGSVATVNVCPWKNVDVFITDHTDSSDIDRIRLASVEVV